MDAANFVLLLFMTSLVSGSTAYNVMDFGAKVDNRIDNSQAFLRAWRAACADQRSPSLDIPFGQFMLSQTTFQGPCKSSIHIHIAGTLHAPNRIWTSQEGAHWLLFINTNNLVIDGSGSGTLNGHGRAWWNNNGPKNAPNTLSILNSKQVTITGLRIVDSPGKHLTVHASNNVHINSLNILSPSTSPNTDGIFIDQSQVVDVFNCTIQSGDDCVAIGTGTSNVNVTLVNCGPGHGISVGSLGNGFSYARVQNINVRHCTLTHTQNGVRIKTWQGGKGYAKLISFNNIRLNSVDNPIIIDQHYCNGKQNCQTYQSAVQISEVTFSGVKGTSTNPVAINLDCSRTAPCQGIKLNDIRILHVRGAGRSKCVSASGSKSNVVIPDVPCLSRYI